MKRLLLLAITLFVAACHANIVIGQENSARDRLLVAIGLGDQKAVLKILSGRHHVNLNHRTIEDGDTFLIQAIRAEQTDIVRLLLNHGANAHLREITGYDEHDNPILGDTPLAAALDLDSVEMVRLLIQHGVKLRDNPACLHASRSIEMLRFLLDHGAPVDGRDENGSTYLQTAVKDGDLDDVARLLIERGANVNIADDEGATPLLRVDSVKMAQLLIEHGARVNAADRDGLTPLHLAAFESENIELAKLLIAHGADVNAGNREGYTPLDILVADAWDYDFALLLVRNGARVNEYLVKEHRLVEEFEEIRRAIAGGQNRER